MEQYSRGGPAQPNPGSNTYTTPNKPVSRTGNAGGRGANAHPA